MSVNQIKEKELKALNGFFMLVALIIALLISTFAVVYGAILLEGEENLAGGLTFGAGMAGWFIFGLLMSGLKIVKPNEARIFVLFGKYHGMVSRAGYHYVNPFCITFNPASKPIPAIPVNSSENTKQVTLTGNFNIGLPQKAVSLKIQTWENERQKVNDILGTPIIVGAIVIWKVNNPTQAVFSVENYREYLSVQTDSIIRNTCRLYPYDVFSEDENDDNLREKTLRGSSLEIAETMKLELQKRVEIAGLVIEEVRITHLAYAEEIAAAMLQRQQASAIIAARKKIVDGAVGMVKMAVDKLGNDDIVLLDEERKAVMVSNLLVVLCGNRDAQPIINSGSIY